MTTKTVSMKMKEPETNVSKENIVFSTVNIEKSVFVEVVEAKDTELQYVSNGVQLAQPPQQITPA